MESFKPKHKRVGWSKSGCEVFVRRAPTYKCSVGYQVFWIYGLANDFHRNFSTKKEMFTFIRHLLNNENYYTGGF